MDEKIYAFDKYIVEYIIFSALVNIIKPMEFKHSYDRCYCTKVMAKYLTDRIERGDSLMISLSKHVSNLIDIIELRHFSVVSSQDVDPELMKNWETNDNNMRLNALLETLYNIRCNLFHGAKEFSDDQVALLQPAYSCLSIINKKIEAIYLDEFTNKNV